jgi:hypothetical protein
MSIAKNEPIVASLGDVLAPRIIIAVPDQWPRALLRGALRDVGYDAVGTRTLAGALAHVAPVPGRGPVRAIVVDVAAVAAAEHDAAGRETDERQALLDLCERGNVPVLLLASAVTAIPPGRWTRILRRPFSIDDVVGAVSALVPLPPKCQAPVDSEGPPM